MASSRRLIWVLSSEVPWYNASRSLAQLPPKVDGAAITSLLDIRISAGESSVLNLKAKTLDDARTIFAGNEIM
jgi:hypothetical protein